MVKVFFFVSLCFFWSLPCRASGEIDAWISEVLKGPKSRIFDRYNISLVRKLSKKKPIFYQTDYKALNSGGFLRFKGPEDWGFFESMNSLGSKLSQNDLKQYIFKGTGATRSLVCSGKVCPLYELSGASFKAVAKFAAPGSKKLTAQQWLQWWKKNLGFNGIIVDRKNNLVLVSSLDKVDDGFTQALSSSSRFGRLCCMAIGLNYSTYYMTADSIRT